MVFSSESYKALDLVRHLFSEVSCVQAQILPSKVKENPQKHIQQTKEDRALFQCPIIEQNPQVKARLGLESQVPHHSTRSR